MSSPPSISHTRPMPRPKAEGGLFARMIQAWLDHYQRLIDAGSHPF